MNKLIVDQTQECVGELTGRVVPPFMKTEGRVLSRKEMWKVPEGVGFGSHDGRKITAGMYHPIFDPTYTVEVIGKKK